MPHFLQAALGTSFGTGDDKWGWPVLQSDWKELFPQDFQKQEGHKMWMMRADGYGHSGAHF